MKKMKRVMIIGCSGAGKSTLARELHKLTDINLIHLDQCYWKANWTKTSDKDWSKVVTQLIQDESWIMDGNFGGTMDIRIERAETIIFMHYPTATCLYRVIKRTLKYWGKSRPDMPAGCNERLDWDFLHYVLTFKMTRGKKLAQKLQKLQKSLATKQVFILHTSQETEQLLASIKR